MSRALLHSLLAVSLLAGCTGNLPTNGSLPSINGENVSSVNAAKVDGMAAAQVRQMAEAVGASTSAATADALVKRDASGNFSAGTITASLAGNASSAQYARGRVGSAITSAATITIPDDGDTHFVTGSQTISALGPMPEGYRVRLVFNGALTLDHGSLLVLRGGGDYRTTAGDEFEFRAGAGGVWNEIAREVSQDSHVRAYVNAARPISPLASPLTSIMTAVETDTQGEFNLSTNVFTPKQNGLYQISFQVTYDTAFTAGRYCKSWVGAGGANWGNVTFPTTGLFCTNTVYFTTRLVTGDNIVFATFHDDTVPHSLPGPESGLRLNHLEITRLH